VTQKRDTNVLKSGSMIKSHRSTVRKSIAISVVRVNSWQNISLHRRQVSKLIASFIFQLQHLFGPAATETCKLA